MRGQGLRLAQFGPAIGAGFVAALHERGQADDVKWKIALAEQLSPVANHGRQQRAIVVSLRKVGLALIPDGAFDRQRRHRLNHAVRYNTAGMVG